MNRIPMLTATFFLIFSGLATAADGLGLSPFWTEVQGSPQLVLRLTNDRDQPTTVLTEDYLIYTELDAAGQVSALIIRFALPTMTTETGSWTYVPPRSDLGAVTLRTGEHTAVLLDAPSIPNTTFAVRYEIKADLAERYDLWQGMVETSVEPPATMTLTTADQPEIVQPTVGLLRRFIPEKQKAAPADEQSEADLGPILKVGDTVDFRPSSNGSLRTQVHGVFKGMYHNYVRVDGRKYRLTDIHQSDREPFERYRDALKAGRQQAAH